MGMEDWTYTSEKLPTKPGRYLIAATGCGNPYVAWTHWMSSSFLEYPEDSVYAWIPFPELPPLKKETK